MLISAVQLLIFLVFPALTIYFQKRFKPVSWLSPVVLCYLMGMLLPNLFSFPVNTEISSKATEITVLLAIPLLLFSTDFVAWLRLARPTIISFVLATISVLIVSGLSSFIFRDLVAESWKISGMLVGVYTGGTPNMNAIGLALDVKNETFIMLNAVDFVLGAIYFMFLISVAKPLMSFIYPDFKPLDKQPDDSCDECLQPKEKDRLKELGQVLGTLALAVVIGGLSVGISLLLTGKMNIGVVILSATCLGIAGSFIRRLRSIKVAYQVGQYILLVFCLAIGSLANIDEIRISGGTIFLLVSVVMFGSILLHFFLAALFRIDRDTVIITSAAAIFGPAFICPVSEALKNREVVVSGLSTSLVGIAVGNFLGLGLAYLLR